MKSILVVLVLLFPIAINGQEPLTTLLADEISILEEGDTLALSYTFEGCYGPYHHGEISMILVDGEIHSTSKSYTERSNEPMVEANRMERFRMVENLDEAQRKESSEILGNIINFKIMLGTQLLHLGKDRIAQRHFVEVFHPFTTSFKPTQQSIIPKISSGGFVH